ncbi:TPA: hypothetical protein ACMDT1_002100 [Vibrio parahaemolyticus]|nr:hypothetical protein [Vibrio parahaemolyticus]EID0697394.1 hypothetical protein [Vibrio parahaemolyticus]
MKKEILPLFEFGVWNRLETVREQELILLKGHLILDVALTELYGDKLSFYGKANKLSQNEERRICAQMLLEINSIRNKLAHEFFFYAIESGLLEWAEGVLVKIEFTKYSKMTNRTKIIHAFSALARETLSFKFNMPN